MKNLIRISLFATALTAGGFAAPFMAIGDGAELFVTGNLGVRADDNIFLAKNADNDLIFDIAPGIDITFGKNAQLKGSLTLVDTFTNYSDNSKLNTNLFNGSFRSNYDDGKLKLGFNVSYAELNQNSVDIRGLTRRDVFDAGANTEIEVSQITAVGGGVTFKHENYKRRNYTDSDVLTVPIDFFYKWTPKTDISVGYQYRDTKVDIGSDSTDHFFNVGARGEFSPKLKGKFQIGLTTRKLDRGGDDTLLGLQSNFTYELTPKTSIDFGASNDFATSPQGAQQKNLSFNGSVNLKLSEEWSINGGASFRATDYGTRTDDYIEVNLGTSYTISANIKIIGGYVFRDYASNIKSSEFQNNVFSVAANFRY
jgi:hypothetical protein